MDLFKISIRNINWKFPLIFILFYQAIIFRFLHILLDYNYPNLIRVFSIKRLLIGKILCWDFHFVWIKGFINPGHEFFFFSRSFMRIFKKIKIWAYSHNPPHSSGGAARRATYADRIFSIWIDLNNFFKDNFMNTFPAKIKLITHFFLIWRKR